MTTHADELLAENLEMRAALQQTYDLLVADLNAASRPDDKSRNDVLRLVRFALSSKRKRP